MEDEIDYENLSHDELLKCADWDRMAAEAFYYRYRYENDPPLASEAHRILKSLAEEWDAMSFWPDWFVALRDSDEPGEREEAPKWRQKILDSVADFDQELLAHYGIIE